MPFQIERPGGLTEARFVSAQPQTATDILDAAWSARVAQWFQRYGSVLIATFVTAIVTTLITHELTLRDYKRFESEAKIFQQKTEQRLSRIEERQARMEAMLELLVARER